MLHANTPTQSDDEIFTSKLKKEKKELRKVSIAIFAGRYGERLM
jgi:hypothetical protein